MMAAPISSVHPQRALPASDSGGPFFASARLSAGLVILYLAITIGSNSLVSVRWPDFIAPMSFPRSSDAIIAAALVLCVLPLFAFADFSFGYLVGIYMYGMIAGFIILSYSTALQYDYDQARFSAVVCLIAFLLPALFLKPKIGWSIALTPKAMDRLLFGLLIFAAAIVACDAAYGFRFAWPYNTAELRNEIIRPKLLNYMSGTCTGAVLPFAFAYFGLQRRWLLSGVTLLVMLSFYPMLLNKTVLFAPAWLAFLLVLFRLFKPKTATVLSLMVPMAAGCATYILNPKMGQHILGPINLRMIAIPSIALDHYYAFFSSHPTTSFCQVNIVRFFVGCPYSEQLGLVMAKEYHQGNFNGSLFTTEGVASLGAILAPFGTFFCGLVIALGNVASSWIRPTLIAVSSGIVVQTLMNVPLMTTLLTYGAAALFVLWLISPNIGEVESTSDSSIKYG